jgi:hypothetical protein
MAEAKWAVCQEEAKANVCRPWPCASDTADRPLRPGRVPSTSERIAWERAGAARGLWLCCAGRSSPMGIALPPRLAGDPSALPPFRKFISAVALRAMRPSLAVTRWGPCRKKGDRRVRNDEKPEHRLPSWQCSAENAIAFPANHLSSEIPRAIWKSGHLRQAHC